MPKRSVKGTKRAEAYQHEDEAVLRPEAGTQAQFKKRRSSRHYRYDSSLSPALDWDGQNAARELGEWLLVQIEEASTLDPPHRFPEPRSFGEVVVGGLDDAITALKALSRPFLNWSGKAERLSFDVPTLPLFVHERLSTKAILETLKAHERDRQMELQLFGDPQLSLAQQLEAYEHTGGWVNRLILGDSLIVMNSLVEYEGLGSQVQMIYIDPPYGVDFGSNFQPFVRRREVTHGDDDDMTREPEMVKAYRDSWSLGNHSYLTYLRDRLLVARDLLARTGSIFVQINDEQLHLVQMLLDEVFDHENFLSLITFQKTSGSTAIGLQTTSDYLLWYARDKERVFVQKLFDRQRPGEPGAIEYRRVELPDGHIASIREFEEDGRLNLPFGGRVFTTDSIVSKGGDDPDLELEHQGQTYRLSCKPNRHWKAGVEGTKRLWELGRLLYQQGLRIYKRYLEDFPFKELTHVWTDTRGEPDPMYVVQTSTKVVERCILMSTRPGDLVLDPTCGSGTTAYVAEQWGRRWITIDTSRVPLAIARQRLLTATFPYYQLRDPDRGPAGGFVYKHAQNAKGEEVGGIVPHITLGSLAHDELPAEEVLVDRPEIDARITRVTGPFSVEATIPTPLDAGDEAELPEDAVDGSFIDRMLEALHRNPVLQLPGNRAITLKSVRPLARSLSLSAEAAIEPDDAPIALVFGPESGAISEKLVYEGAREALARSYEQLIVIGFAIEAAARELVEKCGDLVGIPAIYVQATPDLVMGDLLKTFRSSQIFSVTGLPDVGIHELPPEEAGGVERYHVELRGLDVFDPTTMTTEHRSGSDVPAWLLDTDYNDLCFHVSQAFFPRTSAWENLKRALSGDFEESVWEHLAGTTSAPFVAGGNRKVAIKVIDDRGNELMVVKALD